jgi:hypothetical protein
MYSPCWLFLLFALGLDCDIAEDLHLASKAHIGILFEIVA